MKTKVVRKRWFYPSPWRLYYLYLFKFRIRYDSKHSSCAKTTLTEVSKSSLLTRYVLSTGAFNTLLRQSMIAPARTFWPLKIFRISFRIYKELFYHSQKNDSMNCYYSTLLSIEVQEHNAHGPVKCLLLKPPKTSSRENLSSMVEAFKMETDFKGQRPKCLRSVFLVSFVDFSDHRDVKDILDVMVTVYSIFSFYLR